MKFPHFMATELKEATSAKPNAGQNRRRHEALAVAGSSGLRWGNACRASRGTRVRRKRLCTCKGDAKEREGHPGPDSGHEPSAACRPLWESFGKTFEESEPKADVTGFLFRTESHGGSCPRSHPPMSLRNLRLSPEPSCGFVFWPHELELQESGEVEGLGLEASPSPLDGGW